MPLVPETLYPVTSILRQRYGDFAHHNITEDPLQELLFILCSTKTAESTYRSTYDALRSRYPHTSALVSASVEEIALVLQPGGLAHKKASAIKGIVSILQRTFGRPTLDPLRQMSHRECEDFLTSLPGVGKKVARCVMLYLYALGRPVFPVDEHCWRVARRLGWIRQTRKNRSGSPRDEDRLQHKIPVEYRYSLHVNFISLGREFCRANQPRCNECPLEHLCPRIGV
jgi:endonuclease-3